MVWQLWKTVQWFLCKLHAESSPNLAILPLGKHPKN